MKEHKTYSSKHYRYTEKFYNNEKVSRKTKKFIKAVIKEQYLPTLEQHRWLKLPNCKWCKGCGTYREHFSDTGYTCPDCRGTGKEGWKFDKLGNMICKKTGLKVIEY
jgi:hypothetical protein